MPPAARPRRYRPRQSRYTCDMRADLKKRPDVAAGEVIAHMLTLAVSVGTSFFFEISDYREGPIAASRGTVTNIAMDATSAYGPPREMITIKLAYGPTVVATAPPADTTRRHGDRRHLSLSPRWRSYLSGAPFRGPPASGPGRARAPLALEKRPSLVCKRCGKPHGKCRPRRRVHGWDALKDGHTA